jgi:glycosyltransferase involved in cell wall biosynthesis
LANLISIIVPVHDEAAVLEAFHHEISLVMNGTGEDWELLYIDDGSQDQSSLILDDLRAQDSHTGVITLSRNFGKEVALSAGLDHANGDAVILIDADLQDPPSLIPEFLARWREGYDVVYGRRTERQGESWLKIHTASWFYRIMDHLSDVKIPRDAGDFRLLSRRAADAIKTMQESHRYMKGLYAWIGFPQIGVPYRREPRRSGVSKWNYWQLWNFALEGITSFSAAPLKLSTYLGVATSLGAFVLGLYILIHALVIGNPIPGYPSLMVMILFLGGVQLISVGIIGEYLARTYTESKSRSLYFVDSYKPAKLSSSSLPNENTSMP